MSVATARAFGTARFTTATAVGLTWALVNVGLLVANAFLTDVCRGAGIAVATWWEFAGFSVAVLAGSAVGAAITARFPKIPVGWLVLAALSLFTLSGTLHLYGQAVLLAGRPWPGGADAEAVDQSLWLLVLGLIAMMLLVYPDGRPPPGRRWQQTAVGIAVTFPLAFAWGLFAAHRRLDPPLEASHNPLAVPALDFPGTLVINLLLILGCFGLLVGSATSVAVRYRRDQVQRRQLRWMLLAATVLPTTVLVCLAVGIFNPSVGDSAGSFGFSATLVAVPLAMAQAMSRHRLYSVDRFVDSALVHLALTALLLAAYAAIVIGSSAVADGDGRRSPAAVAVATLLVAGLAAPLRRRLQLTVDRRFHRRRYEAVRLVDEYAQRLRDERASLSDMQPTLARALGDPTLELGLWQPDSASYTHLDGTAMQVDPRRSHFEVVRDGSHVAVLVHDPRLDDEPLLLEAVTRAAALTLENGRLHAEVLARLEQVRASRQRIVMAAYEERRRIERDLHDGAQQRLVSLALSLRLARAQLDGQSAELLDNASEQLSAAVREVRELARGIHPATLVEDGLAASLEALADRTPLEVEVDVPDVTLTEDVAAAAYFTICEAVTNVVKHAEATTISVRGKLHDDVLMLDVTDDGSGGATVRAGGGLQGLSDRLAAFGGRLTVSAGPDRGTSVRAELPCGP
ncbi:MAG: hypothetical protein QOJ60_439 [Actinomycetota bacterium]|nr:hypothetical protein [Actinomycetota bacterium]